MATPEEKYNARCDSARDFMREKKLGEAFDASRSAFEIASHTAQFASAEQRPKWVYRAKVALEIADGIAAMLQKSKGGGSAGKNVEPENDSGKPSENKILTARPKERLSDVSGMQEAKDEIRLRVIEPIKRPEKAKKYNLEKGGGLLLYGLPGTGKTFFAKAVAGELDLPFYVIRSSDILSKYLGDSEKNIKEVFDTARANPMSVIFIDETDGLLTSRSDDSVHAVSKRVEEIILQETGDGADSQGKNPFLLIGATNFPDKLDEAGLSRFSTRIEVELPDERTRKFILTRELGSMEIDIDPDAVSYLVDKTDSFSCRDLVNLAQYYRRCAAKDEISRFTLDFCEKYFKDTHVIPVNIAAGIENFKKRIGQISQSGKKKPVSDPPGETPSAKDAPATTGTPTRDSSSPRKNGGNSSESGANSARFLFADVKGLTEAKEIVNRALINPIRFPNVYKTLGVIPGNGLLLYGPPGTGKTMFARAIANELQNEFFAVSLDDVKGKTALQTAAKISSLFANARNCANGCVIFIDDCEEILSRPGSAKAYGVSQFLNELDGLTTASTGEAGKHNHIFVLIATNRPWMIDGALLRSGRISASVYIGLPDLEARKEMFLTALKGAPLAGDVDIDQLAKLSEGYSGAEIYHRFNGGGICNLARDYAGDRWVRRIETDPSERDKVELIRRSDFEKAFSNVVPCSIRDAERIAQNEEFRKKMSPRQIVSDKNEAPPPADYSCRIDKDVIVSFCKPDARLLKNYVFGSSTIQNTLDYKHFADSVYFFFNDRYDDCRTFNAYASVTGYLKKKYGMNGKEITEDPSRPAIVLYDGLCMAYTAVAAAYMKFSRNLYQVPAPDDLKNILKALQSYLHRKKGGVGLQELYELHERFGLFPGDKKALKNIQTLASAMIALVIAHELGHIVFGDIFKKNEGGVYSRNMERSADRFAADILNGMGDPAIREFLFLGGALSFIADAALNNSTRSIPVSASNSHPNNLERFNNLMKNAPESMGKFNLTESYYLACIPYP